MIKLGLIGTGYWGPNVANSLKATGRTDVAWICDLNADAATALSVRHAAAQTTTDYNDILNDASVAAVAIATPTKTHYDIVRAALEAGKHVLVEKPITICSNEAAALSSLAHNQDLTLMVGHVFQYNASIIALKEIITNGDLGTVNYLNLERTNLGPVRTDVNALWDLVSHDAYIIMDLFGAMPNAVSAIGRSFLNTGVEDVVFATFDFPGGKIAHVHASWLNPRKVRQITAVGSEKMAVWDDLDQIEPIRIYDKRIDTPENTTRDGSFMEYKTTVVDGGTTVPPIKLNRPLEAECAHFIDCIEKGITPRSDGRAGLAVVRALEAATISMKNNGAMTPINHTD